MEVFKGQKVLLEDGMVPATVFTSNGKIVKVLRGLDNIPDDVAVSKVFDAGDLVLMPGLVDSHVHVNEPGRTAWEGFSTATRAACAGGFTTLVDMPLNSIPPTTTMENFRVKTEAAKNQCYIDVAFWGGVVPDNSNQLKDLVEAGVRGFKCFLIHSGVDEFPCVSKEEASNALNELKGTGSVLLFHAEVEVLQEPTDEDPRKYETFLESRPPSMENEAIKMVIELCRESGVRCHIVHLGSGDAVESIRKAKFVDGLPLTVETCHHYLNLEAKDIPDGATQFKCCPPVRGGQHREALWKAVQDGVIDIIVSDHAPCTVKEKLLDQGDFMSAWGGIASLQFGLSLLWTAGRKRGLTLQDIHHFLCEGPASLAGLQHKKGKIQVGYDADFVIWNPDATFTVEERMIEHKNKITPYLGWSLQGVVHKTILAGKTIFENGKFFEEPSGKLLINESFIPKSKI